MGRPRREDYLRFETRTPPPQRECEVAGCWRSGDYRAPKARNRLHEYRWLCLDHVREHNALWNYYDGMSDAEVEAAMQREALWDRPTWPLGRNGAEHCARRAGDGHGFFEGSGSDHPFAAATAKIRARKRREDAAAVEEQDPNRFGPGATEPTRAERAALRRLDLTPPVAFATIKAHYRALVKHLHPDANGGDRTAEEKLKLINQAYSALKSRLQSRSK